jgi:hypothetical protein
VAHYTDVPTDMVEHLTQFISTEDVVQPYARCTVGLLGLCTFEAATWCCHKVKEAAHARHRVVHYIPIPSSAGVCNLQSFLEVVEE